MIEFFKNFVWIMCRAIMVVGLLIFCCGSLWVGYVVCNAIGRPWGLGALILFPLTAFAILGAIAMTMER